MGNEIKKPNKRIVVAGILLLSLVVDLVFIIVLLPKILKKTQEMQEYHINEDVPVMYDGLIKYVDDEAKLLSLEEISVIRSMQFENRTIRLMTLTVEDTPLYVEIETNKDTVDDALSSFMNSKNNYSISFTVDEWSTIPVNIDKYVYDNKRVLVQTYHNGRNYVSFTSQYNEDSYCSLTRSEYKNDGEYNPTIVNKQEDNLLYDFYYYLVTI